MKGENNMEFKTGGITFKSECKYDLKISAAEQTSEKIKFRIELDFKQKIVPETVVIRWTAPCRNVFSQWNPALWSERTLNPNWMPIKNISRSAEGMPVQSHLSLDGKNAVTVSVSDCLTPMEIATGIIEETAEISYRLSLFTERVSAIKKYEATLLIDTRHIPFEKAVAAAREQWSEYGNGENPPENTKKPMYSTWYAYHQNVDHETIVNELKLAKQLGMETVIMDDGWQTDDSSRGYSHCGDWQSVKIADMKKLVDDVHALGMKYMMWYSVPFVGRFSKAWDKFSNMFLDEYDDKHPWCVLDPRYPEVRGYIIGLYESAVKNWGLDGLKLDFINNFKLTPESSAPNEKMDFESLEDAICALLSEVKSRLTAIKPDIMLEFRQPYTGPIMCGYGNMLRVADCPLDALKNRAGIFDLRLTSGKCAVHSDMLMWNYSDSPESAALQLINVFFAVPQISVLIEKLPQSHRDMLKFFLKLWNDNSDCLLDGNLSAKNPEAGYSIASAEKGGIMLAASYVKNCLDVDKQYDKLVFINGSWDKELYINSSAPDYGAECTVYDCTGSVCGKFKTIVRSGINSFSVPNSGVAVLLKTE